MKLMLIGLLYHFVLVSAFTSDSYYVIPEPAYPCPDHKIKCDTLEAYALSESEYFTDNTSFVFLPGTHVLRNISIPNVSNMILNASTEGNVTIQCNGSGGLFFQNASNVVLANLSFISCGQPLPQSLERNSKWEKVQAALAFVQVTDLQFESISVSHSRGYGLFGLCVEGNFNITNSHFTSNKGSGHYLGGNAAIEYDNCTSLSTVWISSSSFRDGSYDGDAYYGTHKYTYATGLLFTFANSNVSVTISDVSMENNSNDKDYSVRRSGGNLFVHGFNDPEYDVASNEVTIVNSNFTNGKAWAGAGVYVDFFSAKNCPDNSERGFFNFSLINSSISLNAGIVGSGFYYEFVIATPHVNCHSANLIVRESEFDGNVAKVDASNFFDGYGVAVHLVITYKNKAVSISSRHYTEFVGCIFRNSHGHFTDRDTSDIMTFNIVNMDIVLSDCYIVDNSFSGIAFSTSKVIVRGSILLQNNTGINGGGMLFCESSYLILIRNTNISLIGNHAVQLGGGIYIEDGCLHSTPFCFYQPDYNQEWNCSNLSVSITMINNTAGYAGHHIYGGKLDKCKFYDCKSSEILKELFRIDPPNAESGVSSNPRRLCFCDEQREPDCGSTTYSAPEAKYPGESVEVWVVTVGQFNGTVPGTLVYYTKNSDHKLEITQVNCTSVRIKVEANESKENITIRLQLTSNIINYPSNVINYYSNISYRNVGIPLKVVVPLKKCPLGFHLTKGICECERKLHHYYKCFIANHSILRAPPTWIGNYSDSKLIHPTVCPYGYCLETEVNITSNDAWIDQDSQCAQNRTGLLCSQCKEGTTLSMGSFKCMKCESKIALAATILSYMLFGVVFVLLLVAFNITYTEGTFSGLLFYANIINIDDYIFLSPVHVNVTFQVIVKWISLNLGFNLCLYDGMDSYAKTWISFFFPNYLLIITAVIIFLCNRSEKLARLFGENIVKVLATLLIVSYTKLCQSIITALSFIQIRIPSNSTSKVVLWLPDPTLEYFSGKHIPLALVAIVFGLLLLAFTMVLLCVQPLQRYSHLRCFSWMAKLKPFIDAYTAPHIINDNCRYWEGLLLFFRLVIFLLFAADTKLDVRRNLIAIVCICVLLLTIAWSVGGVYKRPVLNILNSSCILNLIIISIAFGHPDGGGTVYYIIYTSYSVAIATAVGVMGYHIYRQARSWYVICKRRWHGEVPPENDDSDMLAPLREFNN